MSFDVSQFDPDAFLNVQLTEPTVKRPPLPIGEYQAQIEKVSARTWTSKKDTSKSGIAWDVQLKLFVPPEIQTQLGIDVPQGLTFTDSLMLDLTPQGTIDNSAGKNRRMRAYREALDMNKPGDVFSAARMIGGMVKAKISHEIYEGEIMERITGVVKL